MEQKKELVSLTGLWETQSKSGTSTYHAATVNAEALIAKITEAADGGELVRLMLFTNKKEKETHPDVSLCATRWEKRTSGAWDLGEPAPKEKDQDDDVPF